MKLIKFNHCDKMDRGTVRPGVLLVLAVVVLGCVALIFTATRSRDTKPPAPAPAVNQQVAQTSDGDAHKPARSKTASPRPTPNSRSAPQPPAPEAPPPAEPPPIAEPVVLPRTAETIQAANAITRLTQLSSTNALAPEQIEEINAQIGQIVSLGAPAAAAIQDFLQKDTDLAFGKKAPIGPGSGAPESLRLGLIEALGKIGGPEATSVAADALQKTLAPAEIGLLAKTLEQHAPGEYRDAAIAASREALAAAVKDPNNTQEVAGLFQIIQTYGDSSVIPDLQNLSNQWRYYSLIAVAGLPEGQGVPALVEMATGPGAQASGYQQLATQMLAQLAPTNPDAQAALLTQAKAGQVSNWNEVALALAGARLQYGQDLFADANNPNPNHVTQTHHVVYGNQNFRTVREEIPAGQLEQNRALIDQLMGLATDPAAQLALQRAKEMLTQTAQP
jgi:hypothetical protein